MYVHLGKDNVITDREIVGIFDLDSCTVGSVTKQYLSKAEKDNCLTESFEDIPLALIICDNRIYLSGISAATLKKRINTVNNSLDIYLEGGDPYG